MGSVPVGGGPFEAPGLRLVVHRVIAEAVVGFCPLHLINRVDAISLAQLKNFVWGGTNLNARLLGRSRPIAPLSCGEAHLHLRSCDHLHKGRSSYSHTTRTVVRMGSSSRLSIVAAGLSLTKIQEYESSFSAVDLRSRHASPGSVVLRPSGGHPRDLPLSLIDVKPKARCSCSIKTLPKTYAQDGSPPNSSDALPVPRTHEGFFCFGFASVKQHHPFHPTAKTRKIVASHPTSYPLSGTHLRASECT